MNRFLKLLTLFIVFVMLVQSTALSAFALTPNTNTNLSNVTCTLQTERIDYDTEYNSGIRFMTATTLDGSSADDYYTGTNEYDILSQQSSSAILDALRTLMTSTHKKNSSYADCGTYADNTDCQNEDGKVYLIYTNAQSTSSGGFSLWNREHVWPKSLGGYDTSGPGADLHHIRPSDNKVNSTRNNNKYGNVSGNKQAIGGNAASGISGGTYSDGYFEPHDAVKGDVARICLYMYVRYGGSWSKCSNITNVFQSVDVLLEWCELDPVDTWELGRNEVIEAYQGNRNVFIDYPEYAWLIFGREVPKDMVTPSGEAGNTCDHVAGSTATCTTAQTCTKCGKTLVAALGHSYSNGVCTNCGHENSENAPETPSYTVDNFKNIVNNLSDGVYTGAARYNKICEAITVYNTLTDSEKQSIADKYDELRKLATSYNEEATQTNKDSEALNYIVVSIQMAAVALPFAAYSLLKKKDA